MHAGRFRPESGVSVMERAPSGHIFWSQKTKWCMDRPHLSLLQLLTRH